MINVQGLKYNVFIKKLSIITNTSLSLHKHYLG